MKKISVWWLLPVVMLTAFGVMIYYNHFSTPSGSVQVRKRLGEDLVTFPLSQSQDPDEFGPSYWKALHTLVERLPCSLCRDKAVPFMIFFHDIVNQSKGKPIHAPANYNKHIDFIKTLPRA